MVNKALPEPIRLGLMPPFTGLVALYGQEIVWAARLACQEINAAGGILGRPLELIIEDDGSLPETAVPAARRLVDEHRCSAIIGNLLSNSRIAVAALVAEPQRVPYLNFSFYEGSISSRYFFHFAALPNQQIDKMMPFMLHRHGPKIFFAGSNYEWPRGSIDAAKRSLLAHNGEIVGEAYLPLGATAAELENLLKEVARSGADIFAPYFAGAEQITLLTRFSEMGLKRHMAVVMGHYDEMMMSQLPEQVRAGFYSTNTYFMSVDTPENRRYLASLAENPGVSGIWPKGNGVLTNFGEGAYLCVHAYALAVSAAGTTEAESVVDALEQVELDGPQGHVKMDPATHHAQVNSYLACSNADGTFSIIESFGCLAPQIPERYLSPARGLLLHESPVSPRQAARLVRETQHASQQTMGTARQILSLADMAIIATNADGLISEANLSACKLFGYAPGELPGMSIHLLLPPHFRQRHAELMRQFIDSPESELRMSERKEISGYRKDGSFFPIEASIAKLRQGDGWILVVTLKDIAERKRVEEELIRQATHDPLTKLPNRALIRDRLTNILHRSRRHGQSLALLFIDLDGFKQINDTYGHDAGDAMLTAVAQRLMEQVRPGDAVARLAGDEFVVLCEHVEQPAAIGSLAERLLDVLRQPVDFAGTPLQVTASIGVAVGHGTTHSADDMLRSADTAMYAVKEEGRDGWMFFNDSLQDQARQRLFITQGLRLAIQNNELSPRFQPIVEADSGRIVGGELLLRWHPPAGEISPAIFIPVAEMTGAIVPIGAWVFRQACRAEAEWRLRWGVEAPYVSVNISARQLNETSLADEFAAVLREMGADAQRILLEVTETSLMADVEANLRILRRLADLGLRVAVDDFGTGYSSLAQLTRLPVDVLKIDRAFVDGIEKHHESRTVIRAVIGLGRSLGLKLVAEGVENEAQRQKLLSYGCDYIQGYLFHRPLEEKDFVETVQHEKERQVPPARNEVYFLLYVSKATGPMNDTELDDMLQQACKHNAAVDLTGNLIYRDGYFMQLIEGDRESVRHVMEHVKRDPRHEQLRIVIEGYKQRRIFSEWSMGFSNLDRPRDEPDFSAWGQRHLTFFDLAEDAHTCYNYIRAFGSHPV